MSCTSTALSMRSRLKVFSWQIPLRGRHRHGALLQFRKRAGIQQLCFNPAAFSIEQPQDVRPALAVSRLLNPVHLIRPVPHGTEPFLQELLTGFVALLGSV